MLRLAGSHGYLRLLRETFISTARLHVTIASSQVHTRDPEAETLGRDPPRIILDVHRFVFRIICSIRFDGNTLLLCAQIYRFLAQRFSSCSVTYENYSLSRVLTGKHVHERC